MNRRDLIAFIREHSLAVESSIAAGGNPQAALVAVAVNEELELIFDTVESSRKVKNLRENSAVALVIGGWREGDERTLQYEGIADFPTGSELDDLKAVYFDRFPEGRERLSWSGLVYVRVRPCWMRYCDFNANPPLTEEFDF